MRTDAQAGVDGARSVFPQAGLLGADAGCEVGVFRLLRNSRTFEKRQGQFQ